MDKTASQLKNLGHFIHNSFFSLKGLDFEVALKLYKASTQTFIAIMYLVYLANGNIYVLPTKTNIN